MAEFVCLQPLVYQLLLLSISLIPYLTPPLVTVSGQTLLFYFYFMSFTLYINFVSLFLHKS
jgi:hypothetical protein